MERRFTVDDTITPIGEELNLLPVSQCRTSDERPHDDDKFSEFAPQVHLSPDHICMMYGLRGAKDRGFWCD